MIKRNNRSNDPRYQENKVLFLLDNPVCQTQIFGEADPQKYMRLLHICEKKASTLHHMYGRQSENLYDKNGFMGLCAPCHQFIDVHSLVARELGYTK